MFNTLTLIISALALTISGFFGFVQNEKVGTAPRIETVWQGGTGVDFIASTSLMYGNGRGAIGVTTTPTVAGIHATSTSASSTFKGVAAQTLNLSNSLSGAGLSSCSNGTNDKLLWNSLSNQFSCGTDQSGGGVSIDWRKENNYGGLALTPTTTIAVWLKDAIYGSSTLNIATTTLDLNTTIFLSSAQDAQDGNNKSIELKYRNDLSSSAKANIAFESSTSTKAWIAAHDYLDANTYHGHLSFETKNAANDNLVTRLGVDHSCDAADCEVEVSNADLRVTTGEFKLDTTQMFTGQYLDIIPNYLPAYGGNSSDYLRIATTSDNDGIALTVFGGTHIDFSDNLVLSDNVWAGLGSAAGLIEFDDQATDEVNILNANVGIGTNAPGFPLEIKATGAATLMIDSGAGNDSILRLRNGGTSKWAFGNHGSTDSFRINTGTGIGTSDLLTIRSNGDIGIGTTSPWGRLAIEYPASSPSTSTVFVIADSGSSTPPSLMVDNRGAVHIATSVPSSNLFVSGTGLSISTTTYFGQSVGIGTTSPVVANALGVGGNLYVRGSTDFRGITYTWPAADGNANDTLTTNGAGVLSWAAAGGGGWTDDGTVVRLTTITDAVGIGTTSPNIMGTTTGLAIQGALFVTGSTSVPEIEFSTESLNKSMSSTTPRANTLYRENVVKGWVSWHTNVFGLKGAFNVSSIVDNGAGRTIVNWDNDFTDKNYSVAGMCGDISSGTCWMANVAGDTVLAGSTEFGTFNASGALTDWYHNTAIAIGNQTPLTPK